MFLNRYNYIFIKQTPHRWRTDLQRGIATGTAHILYYFIVERLGAMAAAGVTYLPPVVALFIGCVLARKPLGMLDVIAIAAILLGVFILQATR